MAAGSPTVKMLRDAVGVGITICVLVVILCLLLGKPFPYVLASAISTFLFWFAVQFLFDYARFRISSRRRRS